MVTTTTTTTMMTMMMLVMMISLSLRSPSNNATATALPQRPSATPGQTRDDATTTLSIPSSDFEHSSTSVASCES